MNLIDSLIIDPYLSQIIVMKDEGLLQCEKHNLAENVVCTGEMCHKRIGCQLCIDKHDHKFYLDTKYKQKDVRKVQEEIINKITHLQKYTKSNIVNLKLDNYRQKMEKQMKEELLYFTNKINEEMTSIQLWIEKIQMTIKNSIQHSLDQMTQNWTQYNEVANSQLAQVHEYEQIADYFKKGDWKLHSHVDKSVGFLYSEELFFRFNRNLDALKQVISHHKKEDKAIFDWFERRREEFVKC